LNIFHHDGKRRARIRPRTFKGDPTTQKQQLSVCGLPLRLGRWR